MSVEVLRFRDGVTLKELQDVIAKFVDIKGCPACGLNGFDLRFELDPRVRYQDLVRQFDSLTEVEVLPAELGQLDRVNRLG